MKSSRDYTSRCTNLQSCSLLLFPRVHPTPISYVVCVCIPGEAPSLTLWQSLHPSTSIQQIASPSSSPGPPLIWQKKNHCHLQHHQWYPKEQYANTTTTSGTTNKKKITITLTSISTDITKSITIIITTTTTTDIAKNQSPPPPLIRQKASVSLPPPTVMYKKHPCHWYIQHQYNKQQHYSHHSYSKKIEWILKET